jgi:hypothetical protein
MKTVVPTPLSGIRVGKRKNKLLAKKPFKKLIVVSTKVAS